MENSEGSCKFGRAGVSNGSRILSHVSRARIDVVCFPIHSDEGEEEEVYKTTRKVTRTLECSFVGAMKLLT